MGAQLITWWGAMAPHERSRTHGLVLCIALYIAHYLCFTIAQPFYVEDAGISFAFSRNLVEGEGLVAFAGGERVEGYSNPLWTFIIAALLAIGVPVWTAAKVLGALLGAATLPLVWAITRYARQKDDRLNLIGPIWLACSTQFVVWNASGLENSLYGFLLALGLYRVIREGIHGGRPWSAFAFFLLAITRPDGISHAVVGLACTVAFRWSNWWTARSESERSSLFKQFVLPVVLWILVFTIPFVLYHWWRYSYFAWTYPNTYYAKLGAGDRFKPLSWNVRGWKYLRNFFWNQGVVWAVPLLAFAAAGIRQWRGKIAGALILWIGVVLVWKGKVIGLPTEWWAGGPQFNLMTEVEFWKPIARKWEKVRIWSLYGAWVSLGFLTLRRPGWQARAALWSSFGAGLFFVLYSGGDWMKSFRLFNFVAPTLFALLGIGLAELLERLGAFAPQRSPWTRRFAVAVPVLALAAPNAYWSQQFVVDPETGVRDIYRRVLYMQDAQRKLDLDHVTLLDVDMGAHLWYTDWHIADIAGLVDVPMSRHRYQKPFIREYVFDERNPDFAHVHGGWARKSKINTFNEFKNGYIEIPGYATGGRALHVGNHIRKDHLVKGEYGGPTGRKLTFIPDDAEDGAVIIEGWDLTAAEVPREGKFQLDLWFYAPDREAGFRVLVFLHNDDGLKSVREIDPAHGWYAVEEWGKNEHIISHHAVSFDKELTTGQYGVGLVVLDTESGKVIKRSLDLDTDNASESTPTYMDGEALLATTLNIVSREEATQIAEQKRDDAITLAQQGNCEEAWSTWKVATRHVLKNTRWHNTERPDASAAVSSCWVDRALEQETDEETAAMLVKAGRFDDDTSNYLDAALPLANRFIAAGDEARAAEQWQAAYDAYRTALLLEPQLSHVRKLAEEMRDQRLGLNGLERSKNDRGVPPKSPKRNAPKKKTQSKDQNEAEGTSKDAAGPSPESIRNLPSQLPAIKMPQVVDTPPKPSAQESSSADSDKAPASKAERDQDQ